MLCTDTTAITTFTTTTTHSVDNGMTFTTLSGSKTGGNYFITFVSVLLNRLALQNMLSTSTMSVTSIALIR